MRQWVEGLVGPDYAFPVIVAVAAVVALFVLLVLWRLIRGGGAAGTYVAGGRNRKARLAVMDATAIDNYRRLVLVRRDDVEHLLLIGGSADVVVESNIRLGGAATRAAPVTAPEPYYDQPEYEPAPPPPPAPPVMRAAPVRAASPVPPPRQTPRSEPRATYIPPRPAPAAPQPLPAQAQIIDDAFDDDLLRELEVELDADTPVRGKRAAPSLDDEMSKLLGEMSAEKR